jgi:hypothetical protein
MLIPQKEPSPLPLIGLLTAILMGAGALYWISRPHWPLRTSAPDGTLERNNAPEFLNFSREGLPGKMVKAVELVVRPRQAAVALCEKEDWRFVCVLVEGPGPEKYFDLDRDLDAGQFPFLKDQGFVRPPPQVLNTMSRFRSVARVEYDEIRDRMIVLVCPKSEWHALLITCPELKPAATSKPPAPASGANSSDHF